MCFGEGRMETIRPCGKKKDLRPKTIQPACGCL
nr:MAG TPA: hypothetical protein [Caudoviricetes sp.]